MSKIKYMALNSANVKVNNSADDARSYDIEANVNVAGNNVTGNIDGRVTTDGAEKASFSSWGEGMMHVSYTNVSAEEQCNVLNAINAFILSVKEFVAGGGVTATTV